MLLVLAVLFSCVLAGVEVDLFVPSLPEVQKIFEITPFQVQLTLSINFIAYCICSLFIGPLGDRFGAKKVTIYGLSLFNIGSILCVIVDNFNLLLIGRLLQGIGISAPAILSYVVIADKYPKERQIAILAYINGLQTFAMAAAPIVGSYINYHFGWKANFQTLLWLGILNQMFWFLIQSKDKINTQVAISLKSYLQLVKSLKQLLITLIISFMVGCYWTFIGMASILYVDGFGVSITEYGYYQGVITISFGVLSVLSPLILNKVNHRLCLGFSICFYFIFSLVLFLIALLNLATPMLVTTMMVFSAFAAVFPVTILYPYSLDILPGAKSRAAAFINASKLIIAACGVQVVSYFYNRTYLSTGVFCFFCTCCSCICYVYLIGRFPNIFRLTKYKA